MGIKKILTLLLSAVLCLAVLSACGNNNSGTGAQTDDGDIWSPDITLGIVSEPGLEWGVNDFFRSIVQLTGKIPVLLGEKNEPYDHEFVFGNTTREISKTAYKMLDRKLSGVSGELGWLVYSDGSSVGVAFSSSSPNTFLSGFLPSSILR